MPKELPEPAMIRKLLRYDPEAGRLFWLPRTPDMFTAERNTPEQNCAAWNTRRAGSEAFTASTDRGVRHGQLMGRMFKAHRVAWVLMTGAWPDGEVDHIDCNPSNNRWSNLRAASRTENSLNKRVRGDSASGVKGVRWKTEKMKWQARIRLNGAEYHLGYFDRVDDAQKAYAAASAKLHGDFGRCA